MGIYTEICINVRLVEDCEVIDVLQYMIGATENEPEKLPDHDLFVSDRWRYMLQCSSYYFVPRSNFTMEHDDIDGYWNIMGCANFKNYDQETVKFFDWIDRYIQAEQGQFIGYTRYEEDNEPVIYFKQ